jgi:hypothetical protein
MKQFFAKAIIFLISVISCTAIAQTAANTPAEGNYRISNQFTGPNKVLTLSPDGKIYLADKKENDNTQIWELAANTNGYRRLINKAKGKNFSLDLLNEGNNSNKVRIAATGNYTGQAWLVTPFNNGTYRLTTQWQTDKKSLDVINSGSKDQVHLSPSGNYSGQMWQFTPADTKTSSNQTPVADACGVTVKYTGFMPRGGIILEKEALISSNGKYQLRNKGNAYIIEEVLNRNTCQFKEFYDFTLVATLRPNHLQPFNGGKTGFSYTNDGDIVYIPNISVGSFSYTSTNPSNHRDTPRINVVGKSTKLELTNDGILRLVNNSGQVIWTTTSESSKPTSAATSTASAATSDVYDKIIAMKAQYPQGMAWTDANRYQLNPGFTGCYAFSLILMDAAFGEKRSERKYTNFNEIRIGDMVRVNDNTHSMIVIGKDNNQFTFAEGNYGGKINWGRTQTIAELKSSFNYGITNYP